MNKIKIKTIDINAKEWFDKVNGNSYFSARITLNYGTSVQQVIKLPFQYGYGDCYIDMSNKYLIDNNIIKGKRNENGSYPALYYYCKDKKIILRTNIEHNCLKKDVEYFGQ